MDSEALEHFTFARFTFHLRATEPLHLPPYKGSAFRGGFGHVFKKTVCLHRDRACHQCILRQTCAYSYVFETPRSETLKTSYNLSDYPHPFIIEPPPEEKSEYAPGEALAFHLVLIGRAIEFLPYFVFVYQELGHTGLGTGRGKYRLQKVESDLDPPKPIFDARTQTFSGDFTVQTFAQVAAESPPSNPIHLKFLTPTRIKSGNRLTADLDFKLLMRSLLRRTELLSEAHCNRELGINYKELLREAEAVRTVHRSLRWRDWERSSARQQTRMKLGGFTGRIRFEGDLEPFIPFIRLGEYIHVGKGTSFGLGQYEIVMED